MASGSGSNAPITSARGMTRFRAASLHLGISVLVAREVIV
jgi:hypothetical protein